DCRGFEVPFGPPRFVLPGFISTAVSSPTIAGGSFSGNNAYIKVKQLFAGCPLYRSTSKLNGIFAQHNSQRKRRATDRSNLRSMAPFLDPTIHLKRPNADSESAPAPFPVPR